MRHKGFAGAGHQLLIWKNMEIHYHEWISSEVIRKNQMKECLNPLTPSEMKKHVLIIDEGGSVCEVIKAFHCWFLESTHPEPLKTICLMKGTFILTL